MDQVTLGKTGLKLSRLGFGTGSNSGNVQHALGQETFNKLIHHAYDQGITYFDCAQSYRTFEWIKDAIKGLPREKLFIQSKIPDRPEQILAAIDHHRKVFDTDYVDSLLIHCMVDERLDRRVEAHHGRFRRGQTEEVDSGQGRLLPQPAGLARRHGLELDGGASGARQSASQAH